MPRSVDDVAVRRVLHRVGTRPVREVPRTVRRSPGRCVHQLLRRPVVDDGRLFPDIQRVGPGLRAAFPRPDKAVCPAGRHVGPALSAVQRIGLAPGDRFLLPGHHMRAVARHGVFIVFAPEGIGARTLRLQRVHPVDGRGGDAVSNGLPHGPQGAADGGCQQVVLGAVVEENLDFCSGRQGLRQHHEGLRSGGEGHVGCPFRRCVKLLDESRGVVHRRPLCRAKVIDAGRTDLLQGDAPDGARTHVVATDEAHGGQGMRNVSETAWW